MSLLKTLLSIPKGTPRLFKLTNGEKVFWFQRSEYKEGRSQKGKYSVFLFWFSVWQVITNRTREELNGQIRRNEN